MLKDFALEMLALFALPLLGLTGRFRAPALCLGALAALGGWPAVPWVVGLLLLAGPRWYVLRLLAFGLAVAGVVWLPPAVWWVALGVAALAFNRWTPRWADRAPRILNDHLTTPALACLGIFRLGAPAAWTLALLMMMLVSIGHVSLRHQTAVREQPVPVPVPVRREYPRIPYQPPSPGLPLPPVAVRVAYPAPLRGPVEQMRVRLSRLWGFPVPEIALLRSRRWPGDYQILAGIHLEWQPYLTDDQVLERLETLLQLNSYEFLPPRWAGLAELAQEGVCLSDSATIEEVLQRTRLLDAPRRARAVRVALGWRLVMGHLDKDGRLPVITLGPDLTAELLQDEVTRFSLRRRIAEGLQECLADARELGLNPVLLAPPLLRRRLWQDLNLAVPGLVVLSTAEVANGPGVALVEVLQA